MLPAHNCEETEGLFAEYQHKVSTNGNPTKRELRKTSLNGNRFITRTTYPLESGSEMRLPEEITLTVKCLQKIKKLLTLLRNGEIVVQTV
jgi:hypothetical protein